MLNNARRRISRLSRSEIEGFIFTIAKERRNATEITTTLDQSRDYEEARGDPFPFLGAEIRAEVARLIGRRHSSIFENPPRGCGGTKRVGGTHPRVGEITRAIQEITTTRATREMVEQRGLLRAEDVGLPFTKVGKSNCERQAAVLYRRRKCLANSKGARVFAIPR